MKKSILTKFLLISLLAILNLASVVKADNLKTLTVGHDIWVGYAGYYVAMEKGFFKDNGLLIEDKIFPNPGDTMPTLIAGHLDLALSTLQNISYASLSSGVEINLIYLFDTSNGADAIVAKSSIKSVKDLKGKTVAATIGEVNHMLLVSALKENGMSQKDINLVNMNADDAGAAFVAGKVDVAVTWEPWVTKAKESNGHVIFDSSMIPDTILDAVAVKPGVKKSKKAEIAAFLKAVDQGVAYLKSHEQESAEIIAKALEVTPADVIDMLTTDKIYTLEDNKKLMGAPVMGSMRRVNAFLLEEKMIDSEKGSDKIIDTGFIK